MRERYIAVRDRLPRAPAAVMTVTCTEVLAKNGRIAASGSNRNGNPILLGESWREYCMSPNAISEALVELYGRLSSLRRNMIIFLFMTVGMKISLQGFDRSDGFEPRV